MSWTAEPPGSAARPVARRAASSAAQALRPFESLRRPSSWPALSQTKSPAYGETFSLAEGEGCSTHKSNCYAIRSRARRGVRRVAPHKPCARSNPYAGQAVGLLSPKLKAPPMARLLVWRKERDSNPRWVLRQTRFRVVRLQPAQPSFQ